MGNSHLIWPAIVFSFEIGPLISSATRLGYLQPKSHGQLFRWLGSVGITFTIPKVGYVHSPECTPNKIVKACMEPANHL